MLNRWWVAVIAAAVVLLAAVFGVPASVEAAAGDLALRALPRREPAATVVVAIDEKSIGEIGPWRWRRAVLADLIDRLADGGARAIAMDVLLREPDADDERLARSMRRIPTMAIAVLQDNTTWLMPSTPLQAASIPVHGNFEIDHDGILRRFASTKQSSQQSLPALAVQCATLVTQRPIPVGQSIAPQFRTAPRAVPVISAADVLRGTVPPIVKGKIAFIGATAFALSDRVLTPVSGRNPDPGVMIHAAATESLIRGETIRSVPPVASAAIAFLLVAVAIDPRRRRAVRIRIAIACPIALVAAQIVLLSISGIAIPIFILTASLAGAVLAVEFTMLRRSEVGLEEIATRLAEQRARDIESKRVLAHELRTPIASMRGLTQLLAGYQLSDPERRRVTSLLEAEAGKLQSMVGGLLDLERLPLRDFDASTSIIDLGDLAARRVEFLRAGTHRTLSTSIEGDLRVRGDAPLVERVIDNLVGNALKYAPASPVRVRVLRNGHDAVLEVEDEGKGIPEEERTKIFERFARGSTAAGTDGLGLGLALVGEVARWHGGRVTIGEGKPRGALFRVSFPIEDQS